MSSARDYQLERLEANARELEVLRLQFDALLADVDEIETLVARRFGENPDGVRS